MIKKAYILGVIALSLLTSCSTYKRSFGITYTEVIETKNSIYRLDLSNQNLTQPPSNLKNGVDIKMLNLSGNKEVRLDVVFQSIPNPEKLEILLLDSLDFVKMPLSIRRFRNLKHLSINNNPRANFDKIFQQIAPLPLTFVNLQNNGLTTLPLSLTQVTKLEGINLSGNKLKNDQHFEVLSKLPELCSLWLTNNEITQLSSQVSGLTALRNLYLEHNQLEVLPSTFGELPKVWVVHAGHNNFTEIPEVFIKMKSLLLLHINDNRISFISEKFITESYSLMGVILDNNALSEHDKSKWEKEFRKFFLASF